MVAALKFFDLLADNSVEVRHQLGAGVAPGNIVLPVGTSFQPGDLRVLFVTGGGKNDASATFTGWTSLLSTSGIGCVLYKVLAANSVDGALVYNPPLTGATDGVSMAGFTVRNWDPAQTLSAAGSFGSNASGASGLLAPSRTAVAGGALICNWVIRDNSTGGSAGMPLVSGAVGMTEMKADDDSGTNWDPDPLADHKSSFGIIMGGLAYVSGGATGTKAAVLPSWQGSVPWVWNSFSIFINQAPDKTFTVATPTETSTAGTVTFARDALTSFAIAPAVETDTAGDVSFTKLRAQFTGIAKTLSGIFPVQNSRVDWTTTPGAIGSTVTVKTSIDGGVTFQTATNGGPVPNLLKGNLTAPSVIVQVTLTRLNAGDTAPTVPTLDVRVAEDTSYTDWGPPLGTFVLNQIEATESGGSSGGGGGSGGSGNGFTGGGGSTAGGGLTVALTGVDSSYIISRRTWDDVFILPGGTNIVDAIVIIARNRDPNVKIGALHTTPLYLLGNKICGSDQGSDPWADILELAASIGFEAYFNVWDELCVRPIPDPSVDTAVWTISDGSDGLPRTICGYTKSVDDFTTFSHAVAQGESVDNKDPVMAEWFNTDPTSKTNIYSDFGIVTTFYTSVLLVSDEQCQQAADAIGRFASGCEEALQVDHLPVSFLEPSDLVTMTRPLAGISGVYSLNGFTIPLGANGVQSSDLYRQRAA